MAKKQDNMWIWDQVERTNPEGTKPVSMGKRSFTAIDAQYQRKRATEVFGPFGQGYSVSKVTIAFLDVEDEYGPVKLAIYTAEFWWYDRAAEQCNEFPIASTIKVAYGTKWGRRVDDEWLKKVATDALTKGLSMLGFNADVFMGKFDDNRYVAAMEQEFASENKAVVPKVAAPDSLATFKSIFEKVAAEGGTDAFRTLWASWARSDVSNEEVKKCKEFIKNSPDCQTWLQDLKKKASATDERLEAESAAQ